MARLFGTDGVRGRAGDVLTPELALALARSAAAAGLASAGCDVRLLGVVPTPGVAHACASGAADLGLMISASHNPMPDNGLKLFGAGGHKLPDEVEDAVEAGMGAAGALGPEVYRRAGADVVAIFADADGAHINEGCGATHLEALQAAVVAHGADLGLAHDGDADRCLAVDATGA